MLNSIFYLHVVNLFGLKLATEVITKISEHCQMSLYVTWLCFFLYLSCSFCSLVLSAQFFASISTIFVLSSAEKQFKKDVSGTEW